MATVRVKFRPSAVAGKEGAIYYQVIHRRIVRQILSPYRLNASEWNGHAIVLTAGTSADRLQELTDISGSVRSDVERIRKIIDAQVRSGFPFSSDDIVDAFFERTGETTLFTYMKTIIRQQKAIGRYRTADAYESTLRSFIAFRKRIDLPFGEIDCELMERYESYLYRRGLVRNSTSFYMRILRAVYNRAAEQGITVQSHPFRHVYTGVDRTVKRALQVKAIRRIKDVDLSMLPSLDFARDMFMFSFYTRGMSFVDMAFLKSANISGGTLTYCRRKTRQRLTVRWEKCMQEIVDKYQPVNSGYLLPLICVGGSADSEMRQYRNALHLVNNRLKDVARLAGLDVNLTMYVSRHSWASVAHSNNVPLSIISEGMGHDSESTTQIYLASLDMSAVDRANESILRRVNS